MVSRAELHRDYSFVGTQRPTRTHRRERLASRSDESGAGALLVAALLASAFTAGLAYAVYVSDVPKLAMTEAPATTLDWRVDASIVAARVTNQLSGPAVSVPDRGIESSGSRGPSALPPHD